MLNRYVSLTICLAIMLGQLFTLIHPQLLMKVEVKWFYGSRPYSSFTKQDSKKIIRHTYSASITVLTNHQLNCIAFLRLE